MTTEKVTITEVARLAGVSPGTVSHALNNIGYVNEQTRERIMKAVDELGYIPNRTGRVLKTSRTGLIMMAIPDTSNEIYFDMIRAVQDVLKKNGYSVLLYYTDGQQEEELKAIQHLKEKMVDGLFLVHFSYDEVLRHAIETTNGPIVLCGMCNHQWTEGKENFDTVSIDAYNGIYMAVKHLYQMGHRKIGYLAGRSGIEVYQQRYQAYLDALKDCGLEYRDDYVVWNDYSNVGGYNSARQLYQLPDRPTAICASNDQQAIGCWEALRDLGSDIPDNLALTGMDNLEVSKILSITSLNMKEYTIGEEAARLLMEQLDENGPEHIYRNVYLRPELIVRASSLGSVTTEQQII